VPYLSWLEDPKSWNDQARQADGVVGTYIPATVAVHRLIEKEGLSTVLDYFRTGQFANSFGRSLNEFSTEFDRYVEKLAAKRETDFTIDKPVWTIGNKWIYARTVSGNFVQENREIVDESLFRGVPCFVVKVGKQEYFYTKETLSLVAIMEDDRIVSLLDRPKILLKWPLEQDKQWKTAYQFKDFRRSLDARLTNHWSYRLWKRLECQLGFSTQSK
jgi:hypothetical protein